MTTALAIILFAAAFAAVLAFLAVLRSHRRQVTCPETGEEVVVAVDPTHTVKALFNGEHLKVTDCGRWPAKADCDRDCEKQLHA